MAAWAQQDADAFAGIFHEDGTMILPGLYRTGREEIRRFVAEHPDLLSGLVEDEAGARA